MRRIKFCVFCLAFGLVLAIQTASAQSGIFNYQGSLRDGANPANGIYDFRFTVYSDPTGGSVLGGPVNIVNIPVTNGFFSVHVPVGYAPFSGASRYLQVEVKVTGGATYTALNPRQFIADSPYSVKSQFSTDTLQLGGIAANQYITTTNGGANFIRNTTTPQALSNFNISGNGFIGGNFGVIGNGEFGGSIGANGNSIIVGNSVIGGNLGIGTETPGYKLHVVGENIRVEGNTTSILPRFSLNFTGGQLNQKKWQNYATTNTLVFSALSDNENFEDIWMQVNRGVSTTISSVTFSVPKVGIGINTPQQTLHVNGDEILSTGSAAGFKFRNRNGISPNDDWVWYAQSNAARFFKVGTGDILTIQPTGEFAVNFLGSAGTVGLCRNASNQISTCSSSLRYKTNINQFGSGLDVISRLRPVSFNWLANDQFDFGLVAEEVAEVEPLLVSYNDKGEVEGVKYDRLGVVLINAVKEQNEIIKRQQTELDGLKQLVCSQNPTAEFCQQK